MGYEDRSDQLVRDAEYNRLKDLGKRIVDQVSVWVADNANLTANSINADDIQDSIDMRTTFDAKIDEQLGR